jgi:hypothetical protein
MVISALVSLLALTVLLPIAASGDLTFIVDVEEFTAVTFLALVLHPMDTNCAFDLRFILFQVP